MDVYGKTPCRYHRYKARIPQTLPPKDGNNTGTALFFALMPEALTDDEFRENYDLLGKCRNSGFPDMDKAAKAAFILCDNLYRRI